MNLINKLALENHLERKRLARENGGILRHL
jgi:hypothetical protein